MDQSARSTQRGEAGGKHDQIMLGVGDWEGEAGGSLSCLDGLHKSYLSGRDDGGHTPGEGSQPPSQFVLDQAWGMQGAMSYVLCPGAHSRTR